MTSGAHYLLTVKENQPTLCADISALSETHFPLRAETLDKGYGRPERQRLLASTALNDNVNSPYVAQRCRIERETVELKSRTAQLAISWNGTIIDIT